MTLEAVVVLVVLEEEDVLVVVEAAGWRDIAAGRRGLLYQAIGCAFFKLSSCRFSNKRTGVVKELVIGGEG